MMNEAELHILKQRMYQGKLNKARRGELVVAVPAGYVKSPAGEVTLDPDEQVQEVIRLVFDEFDRQGTVHGVLRSSDRLRHPAAGARRRRARPRANWTGGPRAGRPSATSSATRCMQALIVMDSGRPIRGGGSPAVRKSGRGSGLAAEECLVFLRDRLPGVHQLGAVRGEPERGLAANRSRVESAGAVRDGAALLAGVVWCGRCGRRMYVRYGGAGRRPTYVCSTLRSDYGLPLCQSVTAAEVEAWVAEQVLEALQPAALEASLEAAAAVEEQRRQVIRALGAAGRAGAVRGRPGRPAVPGLRAGEPAGGPDPGAALG